MEFLIINILWSLIWNITCLCFQRLAGATLLIFANKQDLPGALSAEEIKEVSYNKNIFFY